MCCLNKTSDVIQGSDLSSTSRSSRKNRIASTNHLWFLVFTQLHWHMGTWMTTLFKYHWTLVFHHFFKNTRLSSLPFGYHFKVWTSRLLILIIVKLEGIWLSFFQSHHHTGKQYIIPTFPTPYPHNLSQPIVLICIGNIICHCLQIKYRIYVSLPGLLE